ncbi:MAG: N-acetylmuramoyl-L-alanine amidase [Heliobacteriaceae bacterium]|nr:N-acetylmuramoyl-L-alanine amidase [Heliobacteriaceae bacterium]
MRFLVVAGGTGRRVFALAGIILVGLVLTGWYHFKGGEGKDPNGPPTVGQTAKTVVLDPGHGGDDSGAKGRLGTVERDLNLVVAEKIGQKLTAAGVNVVLTRTGPENLFTGSPWTQRAELSQRVELARKHQAAVYVAIHGNSFPSSRWSGPQTFYQPGSQEGRRLALHLQAEMIRRVENKDNRQARAEDYFISRVSHCPAVMVEIGFLSNPGEEKLLRTEAHQDKLAAGIAAGVLRFLAGQPAPNGGDRKVAGKS